MHVLTKIVWSRIEKISKTYFLGTHLGVLVNRFSQTAPRVSLEMCTIIVPIMCTTFIFTKVLTKFLEKSYSQIYTLNISIMRIVLIACKYYFGVSRIIQMGY